MKIMTSKTTIKMVVPILELHLMDSTIKESIILDRITTNPYYPIFSCSDLIDPSNTFLSNLIIN